MSLLIHNANIFTNDDHNTILTDYSVAIEGARIAAVGPQLELKEAYRAYPRLNARGRLLMPGLTALFLD